MPPAPSLAAGSLCGGFFRTIWGSAEVGRGTFHVGNAPLVSGGKNGSVLAFLYPQTCDLAGDYGVSRGDIVGVGAGSGEDTSCPRNNADPICRGPARPIQGAGVSIGERRRHEKDDGGHD